MFQLIIRSAIISLLIAIASDFLVNWWVELDVEEFREYCLESGKDDPECSGYFLEETPKLEGAVLELAIALYILRIIQLFVIIFVACMLLGVWNYYYPIKKKT